MTEGLHYIIVLEYIVQCKNGGNYFWTIALQLPNAVVLNAVGRSDTQMRAKVFLYKWAQKSANASQRAQKSAKGRKRSQKAAKERKEHFRVKIANN